MGDDYYVTMAVCNCFSVITFNVCPSIASLYPFFFLSLLSCLTYLSSLSPSLSLLSLPFLSCLLSLPPLLSNHTAHSSAEVVDLSVCVLDDNGEQRTLYMTQFAYVTDQKQYMAQLLLGSVSEAGSDFSYPIFPPLPSTEALREYDQSLTDALMDSDLPSGWTLVGYNNHNTINSIQGMQSVYLSSLYLLGNLPWCNGDCAV